MDGEADHDVEVAFAPVAGFNLLNLLNGRQTVLVVDTILTGAAAPGTVHFFPMGQLTLSRGLTMSHEISLPTALKLADQFGLKMPTDIDVLAVEAQDVQTLSEEMTPPVRAAVNETVNYVKRWVALKRREGIANEQRDEKNPHAGRRAENLSGMPGARVGG